MARRRSKWRRTWQIVKKMMQESRKVRAYQSLKQCPVCGNPYSLSITVNVDKETDRKSAEVVCSACGFSYRFDEIPVIADEFWVYSKVLDLVQKGVEVPTPPSTSIETPVESEAEFTQAEEAGEVNEGEEEISLEIEEET